MSQYVPSALRPQACLADTVYLTVARHLRCILPRKTSSTTVALTKLLGDAHSQVCKQCRDAGVHCDRSTVRFRNGLTLPKEPEIAFPAQRSWSRVHGKGLPSLPTSRVATRLSDDTVRFHDETPEIANLYLDKAGDGIMQHSHPTSSSTVNTRDNSATYGDFLPQQHHAGPSLPRLPHESPVNNVSPSSAPTSSTGSPRSLHSYKTSHAFTEREAILIRNFVENMALWVSLPGPKTTIGALI